MGEKWSWRPRAERAVQNERILEAFAAGERTTDIKARMGLTMGTVNGVINRARVGGDPRAALDPTEAERWKLHRQRRSRLAKIAAKKAPSA